MTNKRTLLIAFLISLISGAGIGVLTVRGIMSNNADRVNQDKVIENKATVENPPSSVIEKSQEQPKSDSPKMDDSTSSVRPRFKRHGSGSSGTPNGRPRDSQIDLPF